MKVTYVTYLLISVLAALAIASPTGVLRGNKKKLAAAATNNKKIDEFFKPSGEGQSSRKRPAPETSAPLCPATGCSTEMVERISRSQKNHGRRYLKCPTCEAFQWKGEGVWCDGNGRWSDADQFWSYYGPYNAYDSYDNNYEYDPYAALHHASIDPGYYDNPYECHLYREAMEAQKKREEGAAKKKQNGDSST